MIIVQFLSSADVALLGKLGDSSSGWSEGRQKTGYETLSLKKHATAKSRIRELVDKALSYVGEPLGGYEQGFWDCYLIRYKDGSYIPKHKDEAAFQGKRHRRLNALVREPKSGGELLVEGQSVEMSVRDAFLFYPDEWEHEVSPVVGERLLFSVGAWL